MNVILFVFAGRKQNMELQLPLVRRIITEHPNVQYHVWNLSRNDDDNHYLRAIEGERITVLNDYFGIAPWLGFNAVYRHYAHNPKYRDHLFVKVDDDVVFIETGRFGEFVDAVNGNRASVVTAKVVNNGACTPTEPGLWSGFEALSLPLLDVHLSGEYAVMSHTYMFKHWREMVGQPVKLIKTRDWLSINTIGYDWRMVRKIARRVGTPSPGDIAGRSFTPRIKIGDEGMVNMLPRLILQGFLTAHLSFGPQHAHLTDAQLSLWRKRYAAIGQQYLDA